MPVSGLPSKKPQRLVITPKDVITLTGCSPATAGRRIQQVKDALARAPHQEVTIKEYCDYYGLGETEVRLALKID